jgi:hypothetical protein
MSELIDLMAAMGERGIWVQGFNQEKSSVVIAGPVEYALDEDDPMLLCLRAEDIRVKLYSLVWVRDDGRRQGPMFDAI